MDKGSLFRELARLLLIAGVLLLAVGALLMFTDRIPGLGRLPGDVMIQRGRMTLYVPITTCILLSVLLTLLLNLFFRR